MAGIFAFKSNRKQTDEIYSTVSLFVSLEYYADIGIWNIEISYYEQKTFWSLCSYMVRSCKGIEMMVNLINVAYCGMKLLPYQDEKFSDFRDKSVQDFRFALSEDIRQPVFFPLW